MEREFYLFLNSQNSKDLHPENVSTDFTIDLPRAYSLEGDWECALKEIEVSLKEDTLIVCSDICRESYAENTMLPVLRVLRNASTKGRKRETYFLFNDPFYVKVKADVLNSVRLFIRGRQLLTIDGDKSNVRCTLHLRKWK